MFMFIISDYKMVFVYNNFFYFSDFYVNARKITVGN